MPDKYTYLLIDLGTILVPLLFSFHPKIRFYHEWRAFWPANLLIAAVFIVWDALFTKLGVWGFNERYVLGIYLFNLPLEEVLFFICIPYASVFTYHCFRNFWPAVLAQHTRIISFILLFCLLLAGLFFLPALYTSVTFILLASLIFLITLIFKSSWLHTFYFTYLIILLPFFIVNGLLTGTGLEEPVVWYNNAENLGIRLMTIPLEDVFYGMLLLLLNTLTFEKLRKRAHEKAPAHISL